jgi:hypothetical protein
MTKKEIEIATRHGKLRTRYFKSGSTAMRDKIADAIAAHQNAIIKAFREGKRLPVHIKKDYPFLGEKVFKPEWLKDDSVKELRNIKTAKSVYDDCLHDMVEAQGMIDKWGDRKEYVEIVNGCKKAMNYLHTLHPSLHPSKTKSLSKAKAKPLPSVEKITQRKEEFRKRYKPIFGLIVEADGKEWELVDCNDLGVPYFKRYYGYGKSRGKRLNTLKGKDNKWLEETFKKQMEMTAHSKRHAETPPGSKPIAFNSNKYACYAKMIRRGKTSYKRVYCRKVK